MAGIVAPSGDEGEIIRFPDSGGRKADSLPVDPEGLQKMLTSVLGKGREILDAVLKEKGRPADESDKSTDIVRKIDEAVKQIMDVLGDKTVLNAKEGSLNKDKVAEINGLIEQIIKAVEGLGDAVESISTLLDKLFRLLEILDRLFGGTSNLAGHLGEAMGRAKESRKIENIQAKLKRAA